MRINQLTKKQQTKIFNLLQNNMPIWLFINIANKAHICSFKLSSNIIYEIICNNLPSNK